MLPTILNPLRMPLNQFWHNPRLNFNMLHLLLFRRQPDLALRIHSDHLDNPLSSRQDVSNHNLVSVPLQSLTRLEWQQCLVGLELERNNKRLGCPVVNERFQDFGDLVHGEVQESITRLDLMLRHLVGGDEEVRDGGGEVIHGVDVHLGDDLGGFAKEEEVVVYRHKVQCQQRSCLLRLYLQRRGRGFVYQQGGSPVDVSLKLVLVSDASS